MVTIFLRIAVVCTSFCLFSISPIFATAPDFYLIMNQCKTTIGALSPNQQAMVQATPKPINFVCFRKQNAVSCELELPEGDQGIKGSTMELEVKLDIPPNLYLANKNFGDFIVIHTGNHSAVVTTRMLDDLYAGSKVCQGKFMTGYEMERFMDRLR